MTDINKIKDFLAEYDGPLITLMEVCGSHTAAISKSGIRDIISDKIRLVSGPGCPVCVTPSAYIDRLIEISKESNTCVVTFGDLLRVPGSVKSLSQAKGDGANVKMVYSPMDTIKLAKENKNITYCFAAVGFETTTPVYALLMEQIINENIENVRLLTALKTMPQAIEWLCSNGAHIDGFIAPGHVSVITGSDIFVPLAQKFNIPFGVSGFEPEELLEGIYGIVQMVLGKRNMDDNEIKRDETFSYVKNFYPTAVTAEGNVKAQKMVKKYFEESPAVWRGMGEIAGSGLILRSEYSRFDEGSRNLVEDIKLNKGCCCDKVLMGKIEPGECPLFKKVCNPLNPQGACMVSSEGSCYQYYLNS